MTGSLIGSELHSTDRGEGPPVLLIHGTGTSGSVFDGAVGELGGSYRLITYDRRGWGRSVPPADHRRTSIAEQAIEAAGLLKASGAGRVAALGIGFGAVVALELALAEPDLVRTSFLIEPPLFGPVAAATEGMSTDVAAIRTAAEAGGEPAAYELFLDGTLRTLGAGAARFESAADRSRTAAHTFLVELPAVPAWPLDPVRLARLEPEVTVVTSPSTPAVLFEAAEALAARLPGAEHLFARREPAVVAAELLAG